MVSKGDETLTASHGKRLWPALTVLLALIALVVASSSDAASTKRKPKCRITATITGIKNRQLVVAGTRYHIRLTISNRGCPRFKAVMLLQPEQLISGKPSVPYKLIKATSSDGDSKAQWTFSNFNPGTKRHVNITIVFPDNPGPGQPSGYPAGPLRLWVHRSGQSATLADLGVTGLHY